MGEFSDIGPPFVLQKVAANQGLECPFVMGQALTFLQVGEVSPHKRSHLIDWFVYKNILDQIHHALSRTIHESEVSTNSQFRISSIIRKGSKKLPLEVVFIMTTVKLVDSINGSQSNEH